MSPLLSVPRRVSFHGFMLCYVDATACSVSYGHTIPLSSNCSSFSFSTLLRLFFFYSFQDNLKLKFLLCRWERFSWAITQSSIPCSSQEPSNTGGSAARALAVGLAPPLMRCKRVCSAGFAGCYLLLCSQQKKWKTQGQAPFLVEPR